MLFGMLAFAGLVAANSHPAGQSSPYTHLHIERWDGIQADFPYPIYLSDERFSYDVTVTNTTTRPFSLTRSWALHGEQLIWIPRRDGQEILFSGRTGFGGDAVDFDRSPLQALDTDTLRLWAFMSKDFDTIQPGETKKMRTRNGGTWFNLLPQPDSFVPYLLADERLLVGRPVSLRIDPRKVDDFPAAKWEGKTAPHIHDFREVELEGERFLFLGQRANTRMCRIPPGLQYKIILSLDEIPSDKFGTLTRQTMRVSFPGSNEPDYIGALQDGETWSGTAQTDPKLWAKSLPKAANQPAAVVEPVVETTGKDSRAAGPATTGNPSLWPWIGLAVGCIALLASAVFLIRRKG
jgi:hypothetical protein